MQKKKQKKEAKGEEPAIRKMKKKIDRSTKPSSGCKNQTNRSWKRQKKSAPLPSITYKEVKSKEKKKHPYRKRRRMPDEKWRKKSTDKTKRAKPWK